MRRLGTKQQGEPLGVIAGFNVPLTRHPPLRSWWPVRHLHNSVFGYDLGGGQYAPWQASERETCGRQKRDIGVGANTHHQYLGGTSLSRISTECAFILVVEARADPPVPGDGVYGSVRCKGG